MSEADDRWREERANVQEWLRRRTPKHLKLVEKMQDSLEHNFVAGGLPDRDWARIYGLYSTTFAALLTEERERVKMQLLAKRAGMSVLTDDEFSTEMVELGREAVRELSDEELDSELRRRGRLALADGVS
jgi:hypothetical protein